jgi:hypothetical protein
VWTFYYIYVIIFIRTFHSNEENLMRSALGIRRSRTYTDPIPVLAGNATVRITNFYLYGDASTAHRLDTDLTAVTELFAKFVSAYNDGGEAGRNSYVQTTILPVASERLIQGSRFSYGDSQRPLNGVMHGITPETFRITRPENPERYPSEAYLHDGSASSGMVYLGIRNPGIVIEGRRRELRRRVQPLATTVEYLMLNPIGEFFLM